MLTWRERSNLWDDVNDKISNLKEEKTSITMSIASLDGGTTKIASSSTSHWPTSLWQASWSSWQTTSSERWWWFRFPGKNQKIIQRSTVCSKVRNASHALGSSHTGCSVTFVRLKRICHLVRTFVVFSPAVYHERIIFLIHSSFYHDTRTRSTIGSTWSSPRTPSRQAAPSRITLAWKPAEWRKPAHDNSHIWRTSNTVWSNGRISPYFCERPKNWRRWTHLNSAPEGSMQRKC